MAERIAFLGTSDFAAVVLRALAASPHRPELVVTPPDRRRGRGQRSGPPPAAVAARGAGIELLQTADVNGAETLERLRAAQVDAAVVCAFGQLIGAQLLSELELLNVHPSLLPRWRGAAPIERAIMAGDAETGVTIMRLTEGLDSGPIALQEATPIDPGEGFDSLAARLAELGAVLMLQALELHAAGGLELHEQDDSAATYAEKISREERRLDPGRTARELERVVRAGAPPGGGPALVGGGGGRAAPRATATEGDLETGALSGIDGELRLGCAEGVLLLEEVQPPGGRAMAADAYLRGHDVPARAA